MPVDNVQDVRSGNTRYVEIHFTAADAAAEGVIEGLPRRVTLTRYVAMYISGAGATVDPAVGRKAGFTAGSFDELGADIAPPGGPVARAATTEPLELDLGPDGKLFIQPRINAGVDNVLRAEVHLHDGWVR